MNDFVHYLLSIQNFMKELLPMTLNRLIRKLISIVIPNKNSPTLTLLIQLQ